MKQAGAVVGQRGVILDFTELKLAGDEIKEHTSHDRDAQLHRD